MTKAKEVITIKKYSNRRLYNTQTSIYITLDDVRDMVRDEVEFRVCDAKTDEDLTRQILAQIIFEQELNGTHSMMPASFMRKMITMYDHNMRDVFPHYLDGSMEAFMANQERINEQFTQLWGGYNAVEKLEKVQEITQKNIEMMQNTMQLFNPFEYLGKKEK